MDRPYMNVAAAFDAAFTPKEVLNIITALNMRYAGAFESVHAEMGLVLDDWRLEGRDPRL